MAKDVVKEPKDKKSKLITAGVVSLLIIIFIVLFYVWLNKVLALEGSFPPPAEPLMSVSEIPDGPSEAIAFITDAINASADINHAPKTEYHRSYTFNAGSFDAKTADGGYDDEINAIFGYIVDMSSDELEALFKDADEPKTDFLKDNSSVVSLIPEINESDFFSDAYYCPACGETAGEKLDLCPVCGSEDGYRESFKVDYHYYFCKSCGEKSDEKLPNCDKCGCEYEYEEGFNEDISLDGALKTDGGIEDRIFAGRKSEDEICSDINEKYAGSLRISGFSSKLNMLSVHSSASIDTTPVDGIKDLGVLIKELVFEGSFTANFKVEFLGDYSEYGTADITLDYTRSDKFAFSWLGIKLNKDELILEPKKFLSANSSETLVADSVYFADQSADIRWTSSDDSVVTVDEAGYVKAATKNTAAESQAVVTATLYVHDENGAEYAYDSYSCEVFIRYPVESVKLKKNSLTLSVGESQTLIPVFDPKDATVQTIYKWEYEGDAADYVTVDENGVVTAVKSTEGKTVVVYCLTDDGYFRSSCKIKVK